MAAVDLKFKDGQVLNADSLNKMISAINTNATNINNLNGQTTKLPDVLDLKELVFYKGVLSAAGLVNLTQEYAYNIYKIVDTEDNLNKLKNNYGLSLWNNAFVVCTKTFSGKLTVNNFTAHWKVRTGYYENATKHLAGLVSTASQEFSGIKTFLNGIKVENTLDLSDGILRVKGENGLPVTVTIPSNLDTLLDQITIDIKSIKHILDSVIPGENKELPEQITKIKEEISELRRDYLAADSKFDSTISVIQDDISTMAVKLNGTTIKVDSLDTYINNDLKNTIQDTLTDYQKSFDSKLNSLQTTVESTTSNLNTEYNSLNIRFSTFKEDIQKTVNDNYNELNSEIVNVKSSIEDFSENLETLGTEFDSQIANLKADTSKSILNVNQRVSTLQDEVNQNESDIQSFNDNLESAKSTLSSSISSVRKTVEKTAQDLQKVEDNFPVKVLTQGEYNNIPVKKSSTLYFIVEYGEAKRLYIGRHLIARKLEGNNYFDYSFPIVF